MKPKPVATKNAKKPTFIKYLLNLMMIPLIAMFSLIFSCGKEENLETIDTENSLIQTETASKQHSPEMVLAWNQALQNLYTYQVNEGVPPPAISYVWAMTHLAMHDALNSITPRYATYAGVPKDKDADPDAAVAQAAYDVIVAIKNLPFGAVYVPQNIGVYNTLLQNSLANIPNGDAKTKGVALGHAVAQALMAKRSGDFFSLLPASPNQPAEGTLPGEFRYLPFAPAPNGMGYAFPFFQNLTPVVLAENDQFRPGPPYAINTQEYTDDYNEVKAYGELNSTIRTDDQTEFGVFWAENANRGWNEIAKQVLANYNPQSQNAWKMAKFLATLHSAILDAQISVFESKHHYYTWRPISAIRLANSDGNNDTTADVNWTPLLVTPPIPEYPSAHALVGAAAGRVIYRNFSDRDNYTIHMNSGYTPGVVRSFSSLHDAIRENALSRIYIGYHFRQAVDVGEAKGLELGDYVFDHSLPEIQ